MKLEFDRDIIEFMFKIKIVIEKLVKQIKN
jgi:hypothetical protein